MLLSSIVHSTLWSMSKDAKVLYVTMQALADKDGFVHATSSQLARSAGLSFFGALYALHALESQGGDGPFIEKVEGGWRVPAAACSRNTYQAQWQKQYRKRMKATASR